MAAPTSPPARVVLHVVDRVTGGVPVAVRTYIQHSPAGLEHIVLAPFQNGSPAPVWDSLRDVRFVDMGSPRITRSVRRVRRIVEVVDPDVVHCHSSFAGAYTRLALPRSSRARVLHSPHCYAFNRRDIPLPIRAAFWLTEYALLQRTDLVVTCGPGEHAQATRIAGRRTTVLTAPNIASLPSIPLATEAPRVDRANLKVGTMGRICAQKDPSRYVQVITTLRRHIPNVSSTWIGDGAKQASTFISIDNHTTTGWLSASAVTNALQQLDLYIHTAAWEGFPIAILDAHACHVPILVRRIPAYDDLPHALTLEAELPRMIEAHAAGQYNRWAERNIAAWRRYLTDHNEASLEIALRAAWLQGSR